MAQGYAIDTEDNWRPTLLIGGAAVCTQKAPPTNTLQQNHISSRLVRMAIKMQTDT